jgi:ATP-dependent Clp protease ATP-binding subunit ClpB
MTFFTSDKFKAKMKAAASRLEQKQMEEMSLDADTIFEKVTRDVVGQNRVVRQIAETIELRSAQSAPDKPLAAIFISGPTGTGKTFMSTKLAEAVYGRKDAILNIDCGQLGRGEDALNKLFGLDKGFANSHEGIICEHLKKFPKGSVILFDEFEKAAPDPGAPIAKALLAPIDNGECQTNYSDTRYDTTKCIFVLTSNLEQEKLGVVAKNSKDIDDLEMQVKAVLRRHYAPEFFERFDLITTVDPLTGENQLDFVGRKIDEIAKKYDIAIEDGDEGLIDLLVEGAQRMGLSSSRGIKRWLEKLMARELVASRKRGISRVIADYDVDTNIFTVRGVDEPKQKKILSPASEHERTTNNHDDVGFEDFSLDDDMYREGVQ